MATVYLHRKESDNSIYYVGIGNDKKRAREIRGRSEYWTRVFNKYGRIIEIVSDGINIEDAKELEIFLIQEIGMSNLCNHTLGGEGFFGGKHSKETKMKISNANKGKVVSDITKKKISNALKGHPNWLKSQTKEAREKIRKASTGRLHSQITKDNISKKHKANKHKPTKATYMKGVSVRRSNGIVIREIKTGVEFLLVDCENHFNINKRTIAENSLTKKPLRNKKHNGYNFIRVYK